MRPLGQAQCSVMDLVRDLSRLHRMEIVYDGTTCGYLMVHTRKVGKRKHFAPFQCHRVCDYFACIVLCSFLLQCVAEGASKGESKPTQMPQEVGLFDLACA